MDVTKLNWRDELSLTFHVEYKMRFALLPVNCNDGTRIWFKHYFKKYKHWSDKHLAYGRDDDYFHTDFVENITEAEYIVRKLSGSVDLQ